MTCVKYVIENKVHSPWHAKSIGILGTTLDYSVRGSLKISMYEYVDNLLDGLPLDMSGVSKMALISTQKWRN